MNFLTKQFTLDEYYNMIQNVYNKLGNTYYKGLNNKYPPIRLNNNNMVSLAHPKDFLKEVNIFKEFFKKSDQTLNIDDVKDNIYEIYPSIDNLKQEPNGFIALFVSESYKGYVFKHFRSNNEINTIRFIKIDDVVNCTSILQNFITFVKLKQNMYLKFKDLYLVVGETNNLDILNGVYNTTGIYTLFGGKRKYNE